MNNSIQSIKNDFSNCNLLMPMATETQLNPFYKLSVTTVQADLNDNSGDVFKVGTSQINGQWVDVFSPAKPLLMKLAAAAGIQFDPNNTYGEYISKNCYRAKAYGAIKMPDGTNKTHCDEKVINLDDEEDRFRLEFMDKSIQGIIEEKAAKEAEKMFPGGEWKDTVNKFGKPCKAYVIPENDRQKYIDRSVMVNMMLLRKTFAEKALTGAILRVVRALIGLKGTYTMDELKKPFAVSRVTFAPDYNDPEVRTAMLSQGMNAMGNLFGASALPAVSGSGTQREHFDADFSAESYSDNPAFLSDAADTDAFQADFAESVTKNITEPEENEDPASILKCSVCGREISEAVSDYSIKKFGKQLCMDCQKGA